MTENQNNMLEALEATFLNITEASKMIGMNRQSHYDWIDSSDDYKKAYQALESERVKIAESQLHRNISEGKETSLIFFLKCKAGYTEKREEITNVNHTIEII